jgi:predicted RecB family nuclease
LSCQLCEFHERCHAEATAQDDLSLLRGVGEKEIRKYGRRGIFTVTQLSCTFHPPKRTRRREERKAAHSHALQALAVRDKKIYVLGTPEVSTGSARIFLDIEGDPERSFIYLLGLIIEKGGAEEHYSFWADSPREEFQLFQQFLDVGRQEDYCIYTYGSYEAAFLRRMIKESGRRDLEDRLLKQLLNILSIIYTHVYFPVYCNGLKDIAGYLGFRWTAANASGIQSLVWRRRWEETGSPSLKEALILYNLEDCAALKQVTTLVESSNRFLLHSVPTEYFANSFCASQMFGQSGSCFNQHFDGPGIISGLRVPAILRTVNGPT